MNLVDDIKSMLVDVLGPGARKALVNEASPILGAIPEFDSMAVVNVITAMEDRFGIGVDDDEISADTFSTLGSLTTFVKSKLES
jgi:acyl carrier protein